MADDDEPQFTTLAERIAALNRQKNFSSASPAPSIASARPLRSASAATSTAAATATATAAPIAAAKASKPLAHRPPPPPPPSQPPKRPSSSAAANGSANQPASPSIRRPTQSLQETLPPSSQPNQQQQQQHPSQLLQRPQSTVERRPSSESVASHRSVATTASQASLSRVSSATSHGSSDTYGATRKLPPAFGTTKLPPLPPSRAESEARERQERQEDQEHQERQEYDSNDRPPALPARRPQVNGSRYVRPTASPALPPRLPPRSRGAAAEARGYDEDETDGAPPRLPTRRPTVKSALDMGFNNSNNTTSNSNDNYNDTDSGLSTYAGKIPRPTMQDVSRLGSFLKSGLSRFSSGDSNGGSNGDSKYNDRNNYSQNSSYNSNRYDRDRNNSSSSSNNYGQNSYNNNRYDRNGNNDNNRYDNGHGNNQDDGNNNRYDRNHNNRYDSNHNNSNSNDNDEPPPLPVSSRPSQAQIANVMKSSGRRGAGRADAAYQSEAGECLKCRDFSAPDEAATQFPVARLPTRGTVEYLARQMCDGFASPTDKARAIFTWCHHNIAYDVQGFFDGCIPYGQSVAETMFSGKAVCEGYARIFQSLAEAAGLECVLVGGHGKGYGFTKVRPGGVDRIPPPDPSGHAWNAVRIDGGVWKLVDACWGAGHLDTEGGARRYKKSFTPSMFTMSNEDFGRRHFPENPRYFFRADGRIPSWAEYVVEDMPADPVILYSNAPDQGIVQESIEPRCSEIRASHHDDNNNDTDLVYFRLGPSCPHWDPHKHGNGLPPYLLLIQVLAAGRCGDSKELIEVPCVQPSRLWEAAIPRHILGRPGDQLMCYSLTSLDNKDARGCTMAEFRASLGRKPYGMAGVCAWKLV